MRFGWCAGVVVCLFVGVVKAQSVDAPYSRKNTWTLFAEYSNDSSHILMGASEQRKLADFGGGYARRLLHGRAGDFAYQVEVRPVMFESDPLADVIYTYPAQGFIEPPYNAGYQPTVYACHSGSGTYTDPGDPIFGVPPSTINYTITCSRRWNFAQEFSPVGFKYSMGTKHALQPFLLGTGGYMYSSKPIPIANAGSFNFAFDFGGGLELYRSAKRSISMEARFHHFSNHNTADENPGVDNMVYKVSYNFGR